MDTELTRLLAAHETAPPVLHLTEIQALRVRAARLGRAGGPGTGRILARTTGMEAQTDGWVRSPQEAWRAAVIARDLALHEGDQPAAAMAVGLMSVLRRYQGHPHAADLAAHARRMLPTEHPVSVMLLTTHARALADSPDLDHGRLDGLLAEALSRAAALPGHQQAHRPGLSFDQVSPQEVTYAVAIARLRARGPHADGADTDAAAAQQTMDAAGLVNFGSMLRVERAIHTIRGGRCTCDAASDPYPVHLRWCRSRPDLTRACDLVEDTLAHQGQRRSELVATRLQQWVQHAWPLAGSSRVHQAIGRVADWRARQHRPARRG